MMTNKEQTAGLDCIYRIWNEYGCIEISPDADVGSALWHLTEKPMSSKDKSIEISITEEQLPFLIAALKKIQESIEANKADGCDAK